MIFLIDGIRFRITAKGTSLNLYVWNGKKWEFSCRSANEAFLQDMAKWIAKETNREAEV